MLLRSRVLLPISRPPIEDGVVEIEGNRLVWVGKWSDYPGSPADRAVDLGDQVLLPGFVNAHCHLDYTGFAGQIPPPRSFTDWIKSIVALKSAWSYTDFAESWVRGAAMLSDCGVTTVADIEAVPELLPDIRTSAPMRVFSFREILSVRNRSQPEDMVGRAAAEWSAVVSSAGGGGLSPHAPYSTIGEVVRGCARASRDRGWRWTIHVAESAEEMAMFEGARGPLFDWLKEQRGTEGCGSGSPVRYLESLGVLGDDLMAVHVNYLACGDAELLGRRGVHVVHCPSSHAYFGHAPFQLDQLRATNVNVCLGTDSLATTRREGRRPPTLSLLREMRSAMHALGIDPEEAVKMATAHGAKALGKTGQIGVLEAGAEADLIAIPWAGGEASAWESVVSFDKAVPRVMVAGRWIRGAPTSDP